MNERIVNVEFNLGPDKGGSGRKGEKDFLTDRYEDAYPGVSGIRDQLVLLKLSYGGNLPQEEVKKILPEDHQKNMVNALTKLGINISTKEGKEQAAAFAGWIFGQEAVEEEKYSAQEKYQIINFCYDLIISNGVTSIAGLKEALLKGEGFLVTNLNRKNPVLTKDLLQMIEGIRPDVWNEVKGICNKWNDLNNNPDITPGMLNSNLMLSLDSEDYLSSTDKIAVPWEEGGKKFVKEVNMSYEVGKAMRVLYCYYAQKEEFSGVPVGDYWDDLVSSEPVARDKMFVSLGINKYIGQAALAYMMSHLMLTGTSLNDPTLTMFDSVKRRMGNYKTNETKDPFVRCTVALMMQEDSTFVPYTQIPAEQEDKRKASMQAVRDKLEKLIPRQLVPTGLSYFTSNMPYENGEYHLLRGNWPEWQKANRVTSDMVTGNEKRPLYNPSLRLAFMKSALRILMDTKEAVGNKTTKDVFDGMVGKYYSLVNGVMKDNYWLVSGADGKNYVPYVFCPKTEEGDLQYLEVGQWTSKMMKAMLVTALYTHSAVDYENNDPIPLRDWVVLATSLYGVKPQSQKQELLGMGTTIEQGLNGWANQPDKSDAKWMMEQTKMMYKMIDLLLSRINGDEKNYPRFYKTGRSNSKQALVNMRDEKGRWSGFFEDEMKKIEKGLMGSY